MILVTGANGFLGTYICKGLLDEGYSVRAMVRNKASFHLTGCEVVEADLMEPIALEAALKDISRVIHSAALVSFSKKDCHRMHQVNAEGTRNLVNLCLMKDISYFIHISSTAAIGRNGKSEILSEQTAWTSSMWNSCYGKTKHLAELEVWRAYMEGLSSVILNPSLILGYQKDRKGSGALLEYVEKERRFYPPGNVNYVDVRDVVRAVLLLLEKEIVGKRYILCAGSLSYKDFFERLAESIHKIPPRIKAGKMARKLVYYLDSFRSVFTGKQQVITREAVRHSASLIKFDNSKVRNELNFTFVPLGETVEWITSGAKIKE